MPTVRPNVLIIHTDQQRFDTLGCNGSSFAVTPNIDVLAGEGVNFVNHFVQNPVCMPSRMSLLTGRYPSSLGIGTNGIPLPPETLTLAGMLRRVGYRTALVGKLHFQPHSTRDHRGPHPDYGFDTLILSDEPGCYRDAYRKWVEMTAPEALDAISFGLPPARALWEKMLGRSDTVKDADRKSGYEPCAFTADEGLTHAAFVAEESCRCIRQFAAGPDASGFFLFAGFYSPHPPLMPPASCVEALDVEAMPLPIVGPTESIRKGFEDLTPQDWKRMRLYYHAMVTDVDRNVGRILTTLRDEGLDENTLVVFTSDHGEYLGDHGRLGKGLPGFDCIIHTPLIVRYPARFSAGKVVDGLVESVDVLPTILECCCLQADPSVQGRSLLGLLAGRSKSTRDSVLMDHCYVGHSATRTVRTVDAMYSLTRRADGTTEELLFDLASDAHQLHNLAGEAAYASKLSEMRRLLLERTIEAQGEGLPRVAAY